MHELGQRLHRGMGAVRRAEGVVDVGVGEIGEPAGEPDVVGLLPRIEPQVLQQDHVVGGQRRGHHLIERVHGLTQGLGERRADGAETKIVAHRPLRPAEV